jgi:hypothetical protein
MNLPARGFLFGLLALGGALWSDGALAWNSRPAQACSPMSHLPGELWLGHFAGGRKIDGGFGVDWRDEYGCFTSRAACRNWWVSLHRAYRHVDGYGTCLALRGGGKTVVAKKVVKHRTVLRTRY